MKRIEDLPEEVYQVFEKKFNTYAYLQGNYAEIVLCAEHFFIAGYEAAITKHEKPDEQAQAPNATAQTFMAFLRFANAIEAEKKHREKRGTRTDRVD